MVYWQLKDTILESQRAVKVAETMLSQFAERKSSITGLYEQWKTHVSSGREFKTLWQQFIVDARKVP